ncbi:penicillin amidase [Arsukibacterium ikkense]|uniref:Penicillin amidase n=1 Tax=Arsukibacterium ikkense TaxID=336831 RepID=A0A0M2V7C1_9GAMM|nr:penicillin acylase family protein [Arsukibacterium ikkense]KKO45575.1 penicillin amidase [Arsukibacterium ikkense]
MKGIKWLLLTTVLVLFGAAIAGYVWLKLSLPQYQGELRAAVANPVNLDRDALGYLSVTAADRHDAAYGMGFAHAQERFFQMDLARRSAAGTLAELFGERALTTDIERRRHRFAQRAETTLASFSTIDLQILSAYSRGVNDGLASLRSAPFEYHLLSAKAEPWQESDSILVIYNMYLELQGKMGRDEYAMTVLRDAIPAPWYQFLQQHSNEWQAAIDNSHVDPVNIPDSPYPQILRANGDCIECTPKDSADLGSNNMAVMGRLTSHGNAIVANDMHLTIRAPGTWYKVQLNWRDGSNWQQVTGLSLAGAPAIVVGSNGHIAWGFTNSTADWHDLISLQLSDDGKRYLSPQGWQPLQLHYETIQIKGAADYPLQLQETQWGPVINYGDNSYALRWVAYDSNAVNFNLLQLEQTRSTEAALALGAITGIPTQNLLVADKDGNIGWTPLGPLPARQLSDWDTAQDWSDGSNYWAANLSAAQYPRIVNPEAGVLWTANARTVGGEAYQLLGNGGYDLGARGQQIRNGLLSAGQLNEQALHQIQLDNRALFLDRWRQLLLDILTPELTRTLQLTEYRLQISQSGRYAASDDIGYNLVQQFRQQTIELLFAPLSAMLEHAGSRSANLKYSLETPAWAMLTARRPDTLPEPYQDWSAFLIQAVLTSKQQLEQQHGSLQKSNWGKQNQANIRHPLSSAIPLLGGWLNMPASEFAGDRHMPRVQLPTFGQSQRMVVAPGQEQDGILTIPAGQSGHPLSPFYRADHQYWLNEVALPFLPGPKKYQLRLVPDA